VPVRVSTTASGSDFHASFFKFNFKYIKDLTHGPIQLNYFFALLTIHKLHCLQTFNLLSTTYENELRLEIKSLLQTSPALSPRETLAKIKILINSSVVGKKSRNRFQVSHQKSIIVKGRFLAQARVRKKLEVSEEKCINDTESIPRA
jgi:hypothetical protein